MTIPNHDAGIPVLTEVIPVAPPGVASLPEVTISPPIITKRKDAADVRIDQIPTISLPVAEPDTRSWTAEELARMETEITERVLSQMMSRIDFVLEQRIRDSLADVLQVAVTGLSEEIREGLQQTLEQVVARAISQEVAQLHKSKT